ncbi:MAG: hypothetical protein BWK79_01200 [Beggiatoa sp. IS2]|nr:MAG: hypothetical protein BWK79_01200 [Beggiatoa sp. IS2]
MTVLIILGKYILIAIGIIMGLSVLFSLAPLVAGVGGGIYLIDSGGDKNIGVLLIICGIIGQIFWSAYLKNL